MGCVPIAWTSSSPGDSASSYSGSRTTPSPTPPRPGATGFTTWSRPRRCSGASSRSSGSRNTFPENPGNVVNGEFAALQGRPARPRSGRGGVQRTAPDWLHGEEDASGVEGRCGRGHESFVAGRGIDAGVTHQQAHQSLGREGQVAAAELVGLDPGVLPLDVNQPAVIVAGDPQLQRQGTARCRSASAQFRKNAFEKPARVGNVIHREGRVDDVLVHQPAGRA